MITILDVVMLALVLAMICAIIAVGTAILTHGSRPTEADFREKRRPKAPCAWPGPGAF